MNPKARITYRFEPSKSGGTGRLVRIGREDGILNGDDHRGADSRRVPTTGDAGEWNMGEELEFTRDVIPWQSPFQDDPDALERLIREVDGQTVEAESGGGKSRGSVTERAPEDAGRMLSMCRADAGAETERTEEPSPNVHGIATEPEAEDDAWSGGQPIGADSFFPPADREARIAEDGEAPSGYIVPRRKSPAPSWMRAVVTVVGAVLTGGLFGYLVMSMLIWQSGSPDAGSNQPDEPAEIVLPADATSGGVSDQSDVLPTASAGLVEVGLPAVRYHVLQYGVFSTEAGLEEALAQLRAYGYAAAADKSDGYRAYAGIAESREAAEALARALAGVELYIRPLDIPAAELLIFAGRPEEAEAFLLGTNDLMRTMGGLSASLLASGGTNPIPAEAWNDWETSYRNWSEAAGKLANASDTGGGADNLIEAIGRAADAFAAYRGKPAPGHLWDVQSALIEAAVAERDWARASGAL